MNEMSYCLHSRLPSARGAVASEWESSVWIRQSDYGATWRWALLAGSGWSGAFRLWGLCVQGEQQGGGSDVFSQTKSGDVTVETATSDSSFGWTLVGDGLIWKVGTLTSLGCYSVPLTRLLAQFHSRTGVLWSRIIKGKSTFGLSFTSHSVLTQVWSCAAEHFQQ